MKSNNELDHLLLNSVFEYATVGILVVDEQGIIRRINRYGSKIFGYKNQELNDKSLSLLLPPSMRAVHEKHVDNYHRHPSPRDMAFEFLDLFGLRKDGTQFPVKISLSYIKINDSQLAVAFVSDDSLQKDYNLNLEKQVAEATAELQSNKSQLIEALSREKQLNELKSRFVSMASHEFRTPLSSILGSAELLLMYPREDQQAKREKHIKRIISAVTNLTGILNDFLSLEKLESGKVDLKIERFSITEFMEDFLDELTLITKENQKIVLDLVSTEKIATDPFLLRNILLNLLSNAIKYSTKDVFLNIKNDNGKLLIDIVDQGLGIPSEEQKHLFSRFFRAANVSEIKGTGLGLTIVRRYLDLLGGFIDFESEEGKGTTFSVVIPLRNVALGMRKK